MSQISGYLIECVVCKSNGVPYHRPGSNSWESLLLSRPLGLARSEHPRICNTAAQAPQTAKASEKLFSLVYLHTMEGGRQIYKLKLFSILELSWPIPPTIFSWGFPDFTVRSSLLVHA